jgi:hypothetical protein
MSRRGINKVLLEWFKNCRQGKSVSSGIAYDFCDKLELFLNSTTDAQRLVAAERTSRIILERNDLDDLGELREEVRTLELMRKISYPNQTDHSAHSLYVYILGLWLLGNSTKLCKIVADFFPGIIKQWNDDFLFPWVYVSLLHDIGYVFAEPSEILPSTRKLVERFYQDARLTALLRPVTTPTTTDFLEFMKFIRKVRRNATWQWPQYSGQKFPDDTLDSLRYLPWGDELDIGVDAYEIFHNCIKSTPFPPASAKVPVDGLELYAYAVAKTGYDDHSEGQVDHAIASSLFMLQWSSYWYWLAKKTKYKKQHWYNKYFCRIGIGPRHFTYNLTNLTRDIIPALYSVACHNIVAKNSQGKALLPIKITDGPILYLSILCDELQKWDRFPAGSKYIHNLSDFSNESLVSEDITATVNSNGVVFKIRKPAEVVNKIIDALNDKLVDWSSFVSIIPTS